MSKICDLCEKGYLNANRVPRGVGRRVTRRTSVRQQPNLRSKKFNVGGTSLTLSVCTSCLKRMKFDANAEAVMAAKTQEA